VVEDPITHEGNSSEPLPSQGQALGDLLSDRMDECRCGPRREGEEP
jgi:hypothetical protein